MKATTHEIQQGFQPIELTLTIESKEELVLLWHRFNLSIAQIRELAIMAGYFGMPIDPISDAVVWKMIDNICKTRGIKV